MFMFILMMVNRMYRTVAQVRARNAQEASCGRVTGAIDRLMQLLPDFENITGRDLERIASDLSTLRTVFVSTRPAAECLALEAALVAVIATALPVLLCMRRPVMAHWHPAVRLMARALDCRMTGEGVEAITAELRQFTAEYEALWNENTPDRDDNTAEQEKGQGIMLNAA